MELDQLKEMLHTRKQTPVQHKSAEDLERYTGKHSQSVIRRIQRSIVLEIVFTLLFLLFMIVVQLAVTGRYTRLFSLGMLLYSLYFLAYLFRLHTNIRNIAGSADPVSRNLSRTISIIEKFVRFYVQLAMIFIPACLGLGFASAALDQAAPGRALHNIMIVNAVWVYAGLSACWYVVMYFFTRRYVHKLYGSHLQYLRNQLKALEDE